MTLIDKQFEEDLELPFRHDRDDAEEGEAELGRLSRHADLDEFPTPTEGGPMLVVVPAGAWRSPSTCGTSWMREAWTTVGASMLLRRSRTR
jgi:hypothetical protein